jgi:hypothetical protein
MERIGSAKAVQDVALSDEKGAADLELIPDF